MRDMPRSVIGLYQGRVRVSVSVVHCVSVPETAQHPARISRDHAAAGLRGEDANRGGTSVFNPWM